MAKEIALRSVPNDTYWEWKREKEDGPYNNWTEFFQDKAGENDES